MNEKCVSNMFEILVTGTELDSFFLRLTFFLATSYLKFIGSGFQEGGWVWVGGSDPPERVRSWGFNSPLIPQE